MCLLRGVALDALENRARAVRCYRAALHADVRCFGAFERLIHRRMLTPNQEQALMASLHFPAHLQWLKLMYTLHIQQYSADANAAPALTATTNALATVAAPPSSTSSTASHSITDLNSLLSTPLPPLVQPPLRSASTSSSSSSSSSAASAGSNALVLSAASSSGGGGRLVHSADVRCALATHYYHRNQYRRAYEASKAYDTFSLPLLSFSLLCMCCGCELCLLTLCVLVGCTP
jgi:hypothetical protein